MGQTACQLSMPAAAGCGQAAARCCRAQESRPCRPAHLCAISVRHSSLKTSPARHSRMRYSPHGTPAAIPAAKKQQLGRGTGASRGVVAERALLADTRQLSCQHAAAKSPAWTGCTSTIAQAHRTALTYPHQPPP